MNSVYGTRIAKLGKGTYGTVYETDKGFAEKVQKQSTRGVKIDTQREISAFTYLGEHPNIAKYVDTRENLKSIGIIMKKYSKTLEGNCAKLNRQTRKKYLFNILNGIAFCHSKGVWHRDIKPQNILIDTSEEGETLKICDFGFAYNKYTNSKLTTQIGSPLHLAPEVLVCGSTNYNSSIDVWSAGLIALEMLLTPEQFYCFVEDAKSTDDFKKKIMGLIGSPKTNCDKFNYCDPSGQEFVYINGELQDILVNESSAKLQEIDLIMKILCWPSQRISAQTALDHPYFKDIKSPKIVYESRIVNKLIDTNYKYSSITNCLISKYRVRPDVIKSAKYIASKYIPNHKPGRLVTELHLTVSCIMMLACQLHDVNYKCLQRNLRHHNNKLIYKKSTDIFAKLNYNLLSFYCL